MVTQEARIATARYLTRSFTKASINENTGQFKPNAAAKWIANNDEVLDQFPELKSALSDATEAQNIAFNTKQVMDARLKTIKDPKISSADRLVGAEIGEEIPAVLKSKNPVKDVKQLVLQARKDPTGEALDGLRGGFVDHVLDQGTKGTSFNEIGERVLSGTNMLKFMNANNSILREVFPQEQLVRMRTIANELALLEKAESVKGVVINLDQTDLASNLLKLTSRVGGAQFGRWVARFTGGGTVQTPGIFSERFKNFASRLTKDRAFELIHDAVVSDNPELLKALLLPLEKPTSKNPKNVVKMHQAINAWLLGVGNRVLRDVEAEMQADEQFLSQPRPEGSQSTLQ